MISSLFTFPARRRRICTHLRGLLLIFGAVLLGACGSSSSDDGSTVSNTPNPVVDGPIAGTPTLLGTTSFKLADVGYEQREYFLSGSARSFASANGQAEDGKWYVHAVDTAAYKTRILVYRPIDPAAFNGTVIVEWINVSGGPDTAAEWLMSHTEMIRKGYVWVGVSAQSAGIEGGGVNFSGQQLDLKTVNPQRYGSLSHPGDKYAFDIFSQAAQAVLHPQGVNPLAGLDVQHALAVGVSQSADFMVTYLDAIAKQAHLFDGYLVHSRFRGTVGLSPAALTSEGTDFLARPTVFIRDDVGVPVMEVETETDVLTFGNYTERQPDTDNFRLWEIAGTAHADIYNAQSGLADKGDDPAIAAVVEQDFPLFGCTVPVNSGPQHFVANSAIAALNSWVSDGVAPPYADRLQLNAEDTAFVFDSAGNVLGGIRTPYVDVPVAKLSGQGQLAGSDLLCTLFGSTALFDSTELMGLYPDHATFVSETDAAVNSAINAGFLLQTDGDLIKTWASGSSYGTY